VVKWRRMHLMCNADMCRCGLRAFPVRLHASSVLACSRIFGCLAFVHIPLMAACWQHCPLVPAYAGLHRVCRPCTHRVCCLLATLRRALSLRRSMSCRSPGSTKETAEGPIRCLLVRDDRGWVAGGRTEPWLALFDAVAGAARLCEPAYEASLRFWTCAVPTTTDSRL
jgi:hypothetical protein